MLPLCIENLYETVVFKALIMKLHNYLNIFDHSRTFVRILESRKHVCLINSNKDLLFAALTEFLNDFPPQRNSKIC